MRTCLATLLGSGTWLPAQSSWTAIPSGITANLLGICHGAGTFVAVGERGTLLTSPDGLTWTSRNSGTDV